MMALQKNGLNGFHQTNQNVVIHLTTNKSFTSTSSVPIASSHSPMSKRIPVIDEGSDVLLKNRNDKLVYLGIAVEIDELSRMCLVRLGDGTEIWGRKEKEVKPLVQADDFDEDDDNNEDAPDETGLALMISKKCRESAQANQGIKQSMGKRRTRSKSYQTVSKETPTRILRERKVLSYDYDSLLGGEIDKDDNDGDALNDTGLAMMVPANKMESAKAIQDINQSKGKRRKRLNSQQAKSKEAPAYDLRAKKEVRYECDSLLWDERNYEQRSVNL